MTAQPEGPRADLRFGDCLDVLRELDDESVHAIVTDPPYGLADHNPATVAAALAAWISGDREHVPDGRGFMGREWDGFVPPPAVWDECLRVLRPGGHLLAFAGSRTADLMGLSVRMAGFEIRDTIMWVYGSGMPKGINVGKAIDKRPGVEHHGEFAADLRAAMAAKGYTNTFDVAEKVIGRRTGAVANWQKYQFPEAKWWPALRDVLGMDEAKWGPVIAEAERARIGTRTTGRGTGGGTVRVIGDSANRDVTAPATDAARQWEGWNTALKPAQEPIIVARKPLSGTTVAGNVLAHGTGALNVDACRVGTEVVERGRAGRSAHVTDSMKDPVGVTAERSYSSGRWPANVVLVHHGECVEGGPCVDLCPVAEMDRQSGITTSSAHTRHNTARASEMRAGGDLAAAETGSPADAGGASRFFPTFRYQAKAPSSERPKIDGKGWPTVKPLGLMRWLVRLVTPPGGLVLDPFAGTGPTLQAARDEGFESFGIERDRFAFRLGWKRLHEPPGPVGARRRPAAAAIPQPRREQLDLFGEVS